MKQKKKKPFMEYKNMPREKALEDAIKALEKALEKPRLHPAKAYNRKQSLDLKVAEAICSQATDSLISLGTKHPCLLDEPLPQGPDPIQRMKEILRRFKKAFVKQSAETGQENDKSTIAGQETNLQIKQNVLIPTIENIVEIIEKLKTLKEKQAAFVNAKSKALDSDKLAYGFATGHIHKSLKYTGSIEELIKASVGLDATLTEPPLMEDILAGGMPTKTLAEAISTLPMDELQRLLNKFLPELESTEISTDIKYRLLEIIADLSRELERKEKYKDGAAKIISTMNNYEKNRVKPQNYWPEDIKQLMNEIDMLLFPYGDYLKEKGTSWKWEQASIEYFIKTGTPSNLDDMTQELEKIKYKIEVESQQSISEKPAGIKQNPSKTIPKKTPVETANMPELNDAEQNIIEALHTETLIGEKLAKKAGYPYNSNFKSTLSGLRKRGILRNKSPGYFLEPEYHFLLNKSD